MGHAAFKASRNLLRDFGEVENLAVSRKGARDFVSTADKRSEKTICQTLRSAFPDFGFLCEEGGYQKGKQEMTFVVDPLDGTLNFLHGLPHFCISIGLLKNQEPFAGVILDPIRDEIFWASCDKGAFMNKRRLRARQTTPSELQLLALCHTDITPHMQNKKTSYATRNMGSAALDLAYVAAGRLDGFWGKNLKLWDTVAGMCLVKEAFGTSKTHIQETAEGKKTKHLLAASNAFFPALEKIYHAAQSTG